MLPGNDACLLLLRHHLSKVPAQQTASPRPQHNTPACCRVQVGPVVLLVQVGCYVQAVCVVRAADPPILTVRRLQILQVGMTKAQVESASCWFANIIQEQQWQDMRVASITVPVRNSLQGWLAQSPNGHPEAENMRAKGAPTSASAPLSPAQHNDDNCIGRLLGDCLCQPATRQWHSDSQNGTSARREQGQDQEKGLALHT